MRSLLAFLADLHTAAWTFFADQCRAVNHAIEAGQDEPIPYLPNDADEVISEVIFDAAADLYNDLRLDDAGNFKAVMWIWMRLQCPSERQRP